MPRLQPAAKYRHHRIMAQIVVVVHVLVAQRNPEHPLADHRTDLVNDPAARPAVVEARGKAIDQTDRPV